MSHLFPDPLSSTRGGHPWDALVRSPLWVLRTSWRLRTLVFLASSAMAGAALIVILTALLIIGVALVPVMVGTLFLITIALLGVPVGHLERRRLRLIDGRPLGNPHLPVIEPGLRSWLLTRLREPVTWRELAYTALLATILNQLTLLAIALAIFSLALVAMPVLIAIIAPDWVMLGVLGTIRTPLQAVAVVPIGLCVCVLSGYFTCAVIGLHTYVGRRLLGPRTGAEIVQLTRSRERLVRAFDAERKRIERDLHDGAQQRLVSLSITLGLAELRMGGHDPETRALVAKARDEARRALADLRDLILGVHPAVLTDLGLAAGLLEAADACPVPVEVETTLTGRLPQPIESAAYFVVREALTNVTRHSGATRAEVAVGLIDQVLLLTVTDNGGGGAKVGRGTGLVGLRDRLSVLDGTLGIASPYGGPTVITARIPLCVHSG